MGQICLLDYRILQGTTNQNTLGGQSYFYFYILIEICTINSNGYV